MTNHDMLAEGSHKTWESIMREQRDKHLDRLERKALRRAPAGVEWAYLKTPALHERMGLEARGWECTDTVALGITATMRYVMRVRREELSERAAIASH